MEPLVTADDVAAAARRVQGHVRRTPTIAGGADELGLPVDVTLKLELMQHTGYDTIVVAAGGGGFVAGCVREQLRSGNGGQAAELTATVRPSSAARYRASRAMAWPNASRRPSADDGRPRTAMANSSSSSWYGLTPAKDSTVVS